MSLTARKPRVLLYDIETSYIIGGTWGLYQQDVITILQDWQILCFAYKWLGDARTVVVGQDDFKSYKAGRLNDKHVTKALWSLFDEADVIIGHNSKQFDDKKVQARMMVHHLPPPSPYQQIDTKSEMKKVAAHTSNRLNDLNKSLGIEQKISTGGIDTWTGCMNGDPKAWKIMKRYNKQDIKALEELYLLERPWMKGHPSMNTIIGKPEVCPKCGSGPLHSVGWKVTKTRRYRRYQCQNCSGYSADPSSDKEFAKPLYV